MKTLIINRLCFARILEAKVLFFVFVMAYSIHCSIPVISEFTVVTGARGIAVSISGNAPFDARVKRTSSTTISYLLKGCTYGLNTFKHDQFPSDAAVKSIVVHESKGAEIEMILHLNVPSDSVIRTHTKQNTFLSLVSSKPYSDYKWSSLQEVKNSDAEIGLKDGNLNNSLRCIRLLSREKVCELNFDFSGEVNSVLKRHGDTLIVKFLNAQSALDSNFFNLPRGTVFKHVKISQIINQQKKDLTVFVVLDKKYLDSTLNIVCKKGKGLSLFTSLNDEQKAVVWNSLKGLELGYDFYKMPDYEIDMKSLERRALNDTAMVISQDLLFAIKEIPKITATKDSEIRPLEPVEVGSLISDEEEQMHAIRSAKPSGIQTMQQVINDSAITLKVNLGAEVPVPLAGGMEKSRVMDTIFDSNSKQLIRYHRNGRDPFVPYGNFLESSFGLPFIENLRLVGILFDDGDRIALLEDKKSDNRPFTMREEDRVERGKVLKIYRDKVVFLITEYGISRSVTLRLTNTSNQEVGIR